MKKGVLPLWLSVAPFGLIFVLTFVLVFILMFGVLEIAAQASSEPAISAANVSAGNDTATLPIEARASISAALGRPIGVDPVMQQSKLTPSDGVRLGSFGVSVAISGDTVAVGMADTSLPGKVYIFVKSGSGWSNMTQTAELTASDGAGNDYLGYSVAISGDTVVAGAPNAHGYLGAAYVFVKPASGWANMTETAELSGTGTYENLGSSVAIGGDAVVVGSPNPGVFQPGAAYVFVKPASGWSNMTQTAKLTSSQGGVYNALGSSVAISGNTVVAGALGPGKVFVFVEPSSGWANMTETARLSVLGGTAGFSVAISGNTVVAGLPYATVGSNFEQGAAYVFVKPVTGWRNMNQTATLTASDGAASSWFGYGVAIDGNNGNRIVSGAPFATIGSNTTQGAVYTYLRPATGWTTTSQFNTKTIASDGAKNDQLGWSVTLGGSTLVAGAPMALSEHGAAYIF